MKIVSWNIEGRLTRFTNSGRGSPEHILATIKNLDADLLFLAEASDGGDIDPVIENSIRTLGYEIFTVPYEHEDEERQWATVERPTMKLLSRFPVKHFQQIRLGSTRNALIADVDDLKTGSVIRVFGVHLDDRKESYRLSQIADLLSYAVNSPSPLVILGDFNAMHESDFRATILRSRWFSQAVEYWPHKRTRDMLRRLSEMAKGNALKMLQLGTGCIDADAKHQATITPKIRFQEWLPSVRIVQIDHIFISGVIHVKEFVVAGDGGSDHRPIYARITH